MDSLRGDFGGHSGHGDSYDPAEDEIGHDAPPAVIGTDERRLQVRAYNHWASLLQDRTFPVIADLATGSLPDFDPFSVLLDFSKGLEDPAIRYLGSALADECGATAADIRTLSDVPSRSLLSRITDHYMQIHANQAPIGFEAEFVNTLGRTILYRGILLPFSGGLDSNGIDLIYGVINWKELADQQTTEALLAEIDRALEPRTHREADQLTDWADGPADFGHGDVLELTVPYHDDSEPSIDWPEPVFGSDAGGDDQSLADCLAAARELAQAAQGSEDRSRQALYAAIGRAWDFALAAQEQPEDFRELLEDAGLTMQERAPFTPIVKLVFGADYDKTRLTEYASAMSHAQRQGIGRGGLAAFLSQAPGGLKGVVQAERRLRREESGKAGTRRDSPREALVRRLREIAPQPLGAITGDGDEFALVLVRRMTDGQVLLVGEVADDEPLFERAAKRLVG
ncbi:hypothetical protein [Novosphingobium sp. TH158]|uniref:hypothetical protein n=1 Tax=Novosphingobium sp. TH158 TaxID=2067455 RepID=UPI000C7B1C26|nr:hypothetical protein [Novosphingobium sp. TH158]PLK27027.1 hypothetical protein C0V78_09135 [Novosphingobium sp. TH158]